MGMYPVFAQEQLTEGLSCEVEIVDKSGYIFSLGVATADLRNCVDKEEDPNNITITSGGRLLV